MKGSFDLFLETMQSFRIPKGGLILESFFTLAQISKKNFLRLSHLYQNNRHQKEIGLIFEVSYYRRVVLGCIYA